MVISHHPFHPEDDEEEFGIGQSVTLNDQYNFDSILYCSPQASHQSSGESSESTPHCSRETHVVTSHPTSPLSASIPNANDNILQNNYLYDY